LKRASRAVDSTHPSVVQPVTNKLGVLMLNYYTQGPPPKRFAKEIPLEMLQVDDRFFFTTY